MNSPRQNVFSEKSKSRSKSQAKLTEAINKGGAQGRDKAEILQVWVLDQQDKHHLEIC